LSQADVLETLVDLGAGDGIGLPFWRPVARRIINLNYSDRHARQCKTQHPDEVVLTCSGESLPLDDGSVDALVSLEVLHFLPNRSARQRCLAEVCRVLKPDGIFVCSTAIEVGLPAVVKYFGRRYANATLRGMTFGLMLKHCFYRFFDISQYDVGDQVGFNAYQFADDVAERFEILRRINIPLFYPLCTNLMLVCKPLDCGP